MLSSSSSSTSPTPSWLNLPSNCTRACCVFHHPAREALSRKLDDIIKEQGDSDPSEGDNTQGWQMTLAKHHLSDLADLFRNNVLRCELCDFQRSALSSSSDSSSSPTEFFSDHDLLTHQRKMHGLEACSMCCTPLAVKANDLPMHVESTHPRWRLRIGTHQLDTTPPEKPDLLFYCMHFCGRAFERLWQLQVHSWIHLGLPMAQQSGPQLLSSSEVEAAAEHANSLFSEEFGMMIPRCPGEDLADHMGITRKKNKRKLPSFREGGDESSSDEYTDEGTKSGSEDEEGDSDDSSEDSKPKKSHKKKVGDNTTTEKPKKPPKKTTEPADPTAPPKPSRAGRKTTNRSAIITPPGPHDRILPCKLDADKVAVFTEMIRAGKQGMQVGTWIPNTVLGVAYGEKFGKAAMPKFYTFFVHTRNKTKESLSPEQQRTYVGLMLYKNEDDADRKTYVKLQGMGGTGGIPPGAAGANAPTGTAEPRSRGAKHKPQVPQSVSEDEGDMSD